MAFWFAIVPSSEQPEAMIRCNVCSWRYKVNCFYEVLTPINKLDEKKRGAENG